MKISPHVTPVTVAVDTVLFALSLTTRKLQFLVIPTHNAAYPAGTPCLPGGLIHPTETAEDARIRTLKEKCDIEETSYCEQLITMSDINRDPRSRTISIVHISFLSKEQFDEHDHLDWRNCDSKISLAYDHAQVLKIAMTRLSHKTTYSDIVKFLLPKEFTLSLLQEYLEITGGYAIDKRNFRKKILLLDVLEETRMTSGDKHRPAQMYTFKSHKKLHYLPFSF